MPAGLRAHARGTRTHARDKTRPRRTSRARLSRQGRITENNRHWFKKKKIEEEEENTRTKINASLWQKEGYWEQKSTGVLLFGFFILMYIWNEIIKYEGGHGDAEDGVVVRLRGAQKKKKISHWRRRRRKGKGRQTTRRKKGRRGRKEGRKKEEVER